MLLHPRDERRAIRSNSFYKEWDGIARDRSTFVAWMKQHVLHS